MSIGREKNLGATAKKNGHDEKVLGTIPSRRPTDRTTGRENLLTCWLGLGEPRRNGSKNLLNEHLLLD